MICMLFGTYWYPVGDKPKCNICPCGVNGSNTCKPNDGKVQEERE